MGPSTYDLLKGLQEKISIVPELLESAKQLDKFYIPARYPDGWVSGVPGEYITKEDAESAINNSGKIVQFSQSFLA